MIWRIIVNDIEKEYVYLQYKTYSSQVPDGLGVRIPGFHPGGPGSIPGLGVFFLVTLLNEWKYEWTLMVSY